MIDSRTSRHIEGTGAHVSSMMKQDDANLMDNVDNLCNSEEGQMSRSMHSIMIHLQACNIGRGVAYFIRESLGVWQCRRYV